MPLAEVVQSILGNEIPLGIAAYDGSVAGPPDSGGHACDPFASRLIPDNQPTR